MSEETPPQQPGEATPAHPDGTEIPRPDAASYDSSSIKVLKGLDAQLTHTPAGKTSPAPAKPSTTAAAPAASSAASAPAHAEATPLQFKLDSFECQACTVRWRDRTTQPEAVLALQQIQVRAGPVTQDLGQPIAIDLAAQFGGP